jgi:hypothetical protein
MFARLLLVLALVLLPAPLAAQGAKDAAKPTLAGSWALRLDGSIIFRFDLKRSNGGWSGSWSRPHSFASDGDRFSNLKGPTTWVDSSEGRDIGEWAEVTFPDERPGAVPDVFRFHLIAPDKVEMIYVDTGLAPYTLERVEPDSLLGPWDPEKVYSRAGAAPPQARPRTPTPPPTEEDTEVQGPPAMIGR